MSTSTVERLGYSYDEFADAFGITVTHAKNLVARGDVRAIRLGRRVIIPATEIDRLLAGGDAA